jgi:hypothetical protein
MVMVVVSIFSNLIRFTFWVAFVIDTPLNGGQCFLLASCGVRDGLAEPSRLCVIWKLFHHVVSNLFFNDIKSIFNVILVSFFANLKTHIST